MVFESETEMIQISDTAAEQIAQVKKTENRPEETFLRIRVVGGGCSGMQYKLDFETQKNENDKVFTEKGIEVVVDNKSYLYLIGSMLDFSGGLNGKGFFVTNPNAKKSCGCGTSFAV
jgi:iron-sulfur cluster assembly protein